MPQMSAQEFETRPAIICHKLIEPTFVMEEAATVMPDILQNTSVTPDLEKIRRHLDENSQDGAKTLHEVCSELGILTVELKAKIKIADEYYQQTYWGDYFSQSGLDLDKLMNDNGTGLYDLTEEFEGFPILRTLDELRTGVVHTGEVMHADRLARILILDGIGSINLPTADTTPADDTVD